MKKTHKFGVILPNIFYKAYKLDAENGNVLWTNAITKDMTYVKVASKDLEDGDDMPIGYAYVLYHIIFDVKMEDFFRKARSVACGKTTDTPDTMTHTRVVYRETVCLALVISALNDLEVECGDVLNAYITATIEENNFVREDVVAKECLTSHILMLNNLAELLTNILYGVKRQNLVQGVMYNTKC